MVRLVPDAATAQDVARLTSDGGRSNASSLRNTSRLRASVALLHDSPLLPPASPVINRDASCCEELPLLAGVQCLHECRAAYEYGASQSVSP